MQIYNNKDSNTKSNGSPKRSCSYCGDTEHVVTDCPNAVNDWAYFQRFEIPLKQANHWTINARTNWQGFKVDHWFREPREWGKWFEACEKAINKINKAQAKAQAKQAGKRSASKCGFCGATDHNRRDCESMKQFKRRLLEANQQWRQRFYDKLVGELGLSVGAVVNVKVRGGWNEPEEQKIGIIESINWDQLSMFCYTLQENGWRQRLRDDFRQPLEVKVNVEGKTHNLKFGGRKTNSYGHTEYILEDSFGTLADYYGWGRNEASFISTIARSETPLDEEWVNQGHEDAMDFLIKKYSKAKLKEWCVHKLLDKVEEANKQKKIKLSA
jgi:hypothetical protein